MREKKIFTIFDYVDYRFFLRDYYAAHKNSSNTFTYRSFAQEAGVSPSLLKDILNGRQNLSVKVMRKYAQAMHLTEKETAYFEALVCFNNGKTNSEKNAYFCEMVRLRGRSSIQFLDGKQYDFFTKWYHPVVREMMTQRGFGNDPDAIARAIVPCVTPAKVRKSMSLLGELGLVYRNSEGKWMASDKVISSEYEIQSVALKNYHNEMLDRARNALEVFQSDEREFQGLTLSASRETYRRMRERIRLFTDELLNAAAGDKNNAETVFQINIQMFPFEREGDKR
jgi:uncharacterized protein (TIGR02147 family)